MRIYLPHLGIQLRQSARQCLSSNVEFGIDFFDDFIQEAIDLTKAARDAHNELRPADKVLQSHHMRQANLRPLPVGDSDEVVSVDAHLWSKVIDEDLPVSFSSVGICSHPHLFPLSISQLSCESVWLLFRRRYRNYKVEFVERVPLG